VGNLPPWLDIIFVGLMGSMATTGIITGSFAPLFPAITRKSKPVAFWLVLVFCTVIVADFLFAISDAIRGA
jgi:hypothetical protein